MDSRKCRDESCGPYRLGAFLLLLSVVLVGCGSSSPAQPASAGMGRVNSASAHVALGRVTYTPAQVWKIQHGADAREPGYWLYLNPARVVALELPRRGLRAPFQIYPPVRVTVGYRHRLYTVLLSQPVEQGSKGIWVISGVTAQPVAGDEGEGAGAPERGSRYATRVVRLGPVRHTAMEINRIQEAVRRGDPAYAYYVNPVQVVVRQLPHFGFHGRLELRPELNVRVVEGTVNYDVELSQPARKGSAGIWLVSAIRLQSPEQEPPGGDGD